MRKSLTLYATPVITLIIVVLSVDGIVEVIRERIGENTPIYIGTGLVVLMIINHIFTVVSPYRKYERVARNKWEILESVVQNFSRKYRHYELQFNIMKPQIQFCYCIEPKAGNNKTRRFTFIGKVFKVLWTSENHLHRQFKMTVNQGASGKAYRSGIGVVASQFANGKATDFNFSQEQEALSDGLTMVASCPIFEINSDPEHKIGKVIGVLNVQSKADGAEKLVMISSPAKAAFGEELVTLSEFISKLAI